MSVRRTSYLYVLLALGLLAAGDPALAQTVSADFDAATIAPLLAYDYLDVTRSFVAGTPAGLAHRVVVDFESSSVTFDPDTVQTDFEMRMTVTDFSGSGSFGLANLSSFLQGYAFVYQPGLNTIAIVRVDGRYSYTPLESASWPLDPSHQTLLVFSRQNNVLRGTVHDLTDPWWSFTISAIDVTYTSGSPGFVGLDSAFTVDDFCASPDSSCSGTAANDVAMVTEDAPPTTIDVLANDTLFPGVGISSVSQPLHGTVAINFAASALTYQPFPNYCNSGGAPDGFAYYVGGGFSGATVSVIVNCVDDPPVAVDDTATVAEDSANTSLFVLSNDTDIDGGVTFISSFTQPPNGTVVSFGAFFGYTPDPNYCNGGSPTDDFTYTLSPGTSTATVRVTVTCVDDPPVAVNDTATVAENSGGTPLPVLDNDTDIDGGIRFISSITQPPNGTVVSLGSFLEYTPDPDYCNDGSPTDDFTYTLSPGDTIATVAVTVTCVVILPVAVDDAASVDQNAPATAVAVLANDIPGDGGPGSIASVTQPANGSVAITGGGSGLTYQPDADYCNDGSPTDDFTYTLSPGGSSATVQMTVLCPIVTPLSVLTTSYWSPGVNDGKPANLINGFGLSGAGPISSRTHDNDAAASTMWCAGDADGGLGGPTGTPPLVADQKILFVLPGQVDLAGAYIWNHNQSCCTTRGVHEFEILVSSDADPETASFMSLGTFALNKAGGTAAEPSQLVSFSAPNVRLVRFDVISAYTSPAGPDDYVGLSEVRFVPQAPTPAVPSLSLPGLALLVLALGAVASAGLRRRTRPS